MKREYRVCPRKFKCVWAEQSDDARFCMFSVCPYTAISDGARVEFHLLRVKTQQRAV